MPTAEYQEYIRSQEWRAVRARKIVEDGDVQIKCEICAGFFPAPQIHMHHLNYDRLGEELNGDLQIVCRSCHEVLEGKQFAGPNTRLARLSEARGPSDIVAPIAKSAKILTTGLKDLDRNCQIEQSDFIVIGGRPGMGKTSLAIQIAGHAAIDDGHEVLFYAIEGGAVLCGTALAVSRGIITADQSRIGRLSDSERERLATEFGRQISPAPIFIIDEQQLSFEKIADGIARFASRRQRLSLVVLDFIQLVDTGPDIRYRDPLVIAGARKLRGVCKSLGCAMIVLSQLSRRHDSRKDGRARLDDLPGMGELADQADKVWLIHRSHYYDADADERAAELIVAKNRTGSTQDVPLQWNKEHLRFENHAWETADFSRQF